MDVSCREFWPEQGRTVVDRSRTRRRATGISVDALVGRDGAAPIAAGRRAHRRRSLRQPRLLAACAVMSVAAAGASTLVLMPDDVPPLPRPAPGEQAAAHQFVPPPAATPAPAEPQVVKAEQIAALPGTAAAAPIPPRTTRAPTPTSRSQPTRSPERAPSSRSQDLEVTEEVDEVTEEVDEPAARRTKGTPDLRGVKVRDRGSESRRRGPKGDPRGE
jgi:hypothetical protein